MAIKLLLFSMGRSNHAATGPVIRRRQFLLGIGAGPDITEIQLVSNQTPLEEDTEAITATPEVMPVPSAMAVLLDGAGVDPRGFTAVLGVGSLMPTVSAVRFARMLNLPVWADLFGDPLAEFHAAQVRTGEPLNIPLRDLVWKFQREVLAHADRISTVSDAQRHATLGQLLLLGRVRAEADVTSRVVEIPCAVPDAWCEVTPAPPFPPELARQGLKPSTLMLYFGGSWNAWLDDEAIARRLAVLAASIPALRIIFAPIITNEADAHRCEHFLKEVERLKFAGSLHRIPPPEGRGEDAILAHMNAAILLDREIPESLLGSRNRLLSFIRCGTVPLVSPNSELCHSLLAHGLAVDAATPTDAQLLEELQLILAYTPEERQQWRRTAAEYLRHVTFQKTMLPVREWIKNPVRWPAAPMPHGLAEEWAAIPQWDSPAPGKLSLWQRLFS